MFKLQIDEELSLALIDFSFAKKWLYIVQSEREYLSEWLAWPMHAKDESFFNRFVTSQLQLYAENKALACAILYQDEYVGSISFNTINQSLKCCEIGYWLSQKFQGKAIVTRSVEKLIELGFEKYQMEKIQISAAKENLKSRAIPERLGFTLEGIITHNENLNGRIVDHAVYGLLRKNWKKS